MSPSSPSTIINLSIVSRPTFRLAGARIRTEMLYAEKDIKKLWMEILPQIREFLSDPATAVYGISWLVDPDALSFDYYAAIKLPDNYVLPEGFSEIVIPAGLYAECELPSRDMLRRLYSYLYYEWLPAHKDNFVLGNAPCYEVYSRNFLEAGSLKVYMPVVAA